MNLFTISGEMKTTSPVFIVGMPRSGTSILYRTLQKHSSFTCRQENLQETKLLNHANRSHLFKRDKPEALLNFMLNDSQRYQDFLESIRPIQLLHKSIPRSFNDVLSSRSPLWWRLNLNTLVVRAYFYYAKQARECNRLLEKSPNNLYQAEKLHSTFPLCKMLLIYRHPLDVYASYCKRKKIDSTATWADMDPGTFANFYSTAIDRAITCKDRYSGQFMIVKYEDFTTQPEDTLSLICDYLHEPMQKEMLIEHNPDPNKWKIDPNLFCAITSKVKNWQKFMAPETGQRVEDMLCRHMEKLGYSRYTQA
jgi:hypothetical protein